MTRHLYTLLHYLLLPFILLSFKFRTRRHPGYGRHLDQRLGKGPLIFPEMGSSPIWIHAVSVGETIAVAPLIHLLQKRHPEWPLLITSTTPTGAEQVQRLFGDTVTAGYAPLDIPWAVRRFLRCVKPRALLVVETELWPNWVAEMQKQSIPVAVVNARLSEKSAAGYGRLRGLGRGMMAGLSLVAAQYPVDAQRFIAAGAHQDKVRVLGNLKSDIHKPSVSKLDPASTARRQLGLPRAAGGPLILAASTHPGEDEIVIDAFKHLKERVPGVRLLLVPRHSERCGDIEVLIQRRGLECTRRSATAENQQAGILLGDQMGELMALFGAADMVVMGGTLVDHGGHNPLEPAAWSLATLAGPYRRNFASLYEDMEEIGALISVGVDAEGLACSLASFWQDAEWRDRSGQAALNYLEQGRGATERTLEALQLLLPN